MHKLLLFILLLVGSFIDYCQSETNESSIGVPPVYIHGRRYHITEECNTTTTTSNNPISSNDTNNKSIARTSSADTKEDSTIRNNEDGISYSGTSSSSSSNIVRPVELLKVPCVVNGVELDAFVDTGAQVTVISFEGLRRLGMENEIDRSYRGQAVGVSGSSYIVGRIRLPMTLGTSIKVPDLQVIVIQDELGGGSVDLLLGLDILSRLDASICLRRRILTMYDRRGSRAKTIPFASSRDEDDNNNRFHKKADVYDRKRYKTEHETTASEEIVREFGWKLPEVDVKKYVDNFIDKTVETTAKHLPAYLSKIGKSELSSYDEYDDQYYDESSDSEDNW